MPEIPEDPTGRDSTPPHPRPAGQREYLTHFAIAGFTYYDGALAFQHLQPGTPLHLASEPDNKYDPQAVALFYKDYKLGYIPRSHNTIVHKLLKVGFNNLQAVVQRTDSSEHPEQQVGVVVHLGEAELMEHGIGD